MKSVKAFKDHALEVVAAVTLLVGTVPSASGTVVIYPPDWICWNDTTICFYVAYKCQPGTDRILSAAVNGTAASQVGDCTYDSGLDMMWCSFCWTRPAGVTSLTTVTFTASFGDCGQDTKNVTAQPPGCKDPVLATGGFWECFHWAWDLECHTDQKIYNLFSREAYHCTRLPDPPVPLINCTGNCNLQPHTWYDGSPAYPQITQGVYNDSCEGGDVDMTLVADMYYGCTDCIGNQAVYGTCFTSPAPGNVIEQGPRGYGMIHCQ